MDKKTIFMQKCPKCGDYCKDENTEFRCVICGYVEQKNIGDYITVVEAAMKFTREYRGNLIKGCTLKYIYDMIHAKKIDFMKIGSVYLVHKNLKIRTIEKIIDDNC